MPPELGRRTYALGALVLGIAQLVFGDFAVMWQPVQLAGPHRVILSYLTGILLVLGGALVWPRRTARIGAGILGTIYTVFALLWLPRVIGFPQIFGTWGGMLEELAPATAALVIYGVTSRDGSVGGEWIAQIGRYAFGICALSFGIVHFTAIPQTASLVPAWIPGGGRFWAIATGAFHMLAGLAIITGIFATLGARLLGVMLIGFGVFIWLPRMFTAPHVHATWAGNGVNLGVAGAAWVVADWLARRNRGAGAPGVP